MTATSDMVLIVRDGPNAGEEHPIDGDLVLGRAEGDVDVVIADRGVSRRHASVAIQGQTAIVSDLDSSNGTYVNGEEVDAPRRLRGGDVIQIGGTHLELHSADETTAVIGAGAGAAGAHYPPTEAVTPPRQAPPPPPPPRREPPPQPEPVRQGQIDEDENWQAVAAICLGPLALLLVLFSYGALYVFSFVLGVGAIILGTLGKRAVTSGRSRRFYGLARWGRTAGVISVVLSVIAFLLLVVVAGLIDVAADNIGQLIDDIREQIEGL